MIHPFRIFQGKDKRDISAVRKAQDMRFFDTFFIHKIMQILGELPDGERLLPAGRLPVSPGVQSDHAVPFLKIFDLMYKIAAVLPVTVEENKRCA